MNTITLICKDIFFYSNLDEAVFFEWIKKISSIQDCKGVADELHLDVKVAMSDDALRNLIALFARYAIEMNDLKQFVTDENRQWFKNKQAYWYSNVFK